MTLQQYQTTLFDQSETLTLYVAGFRAKAFSIAGKKGLKTHEVHSFFQIARFASILKPRYLFLENVKGLLHHDGGGNVRNNPQTLEELGYDVEWQVLNSKHFGYHKTANACSLSDILEEQVDEKYFLSETVTKKVDKLPSEKKYNQYTRRKVPRLSIGVVYYWKSTSERNSR